MTRRLASKAYWLCNIIRGREWVPGIDVRRYWERLGSEYGGWNVATDLLSKDAIVYSFGVGDDITFDLALIARFGLEVHAFDPTPRSVEWIRTCALPAGFFFHACGIAAFDGAAKFAAPPNPLHVSFALTDSPNAAHMVTCAVKKLSTIMQELQHDRVDLLKMDIEGAEYSVLNEVLLSPVRPAQILVEFHHRLHSGMVPETRQTVARLRENGYRLFSVSDGGEEYSFVRS